MALNSRVGGALVQLFRVPVTRRRPGRRTAARCISEILEHRALLANHPLTAIPALNSLPGAPVTIYLDFDGHTETEDWPDEDEQSVLTPVFSVDSDLTTFSDEELRIINEVWYRVAEDYIPFRVNVTTVNPGNISNFNGILVSIGGNASWFGNSPGLLGIAFLDSFSNDLVNTCYVFSDNHLSFSDFANQLALTASHEAGHTFGLQHHSQFDSSGNKIDEYDPGTTRLGAIMGSPLNSERTTWNNGPANTTVTVLQDDLAVMTRAANQTFVFRADDVGDTFGTATVPVVSGTTISTAGIVGQNNDVDMFRFSTNAGSISFTVEGLNLNRIYPSLTLNPGTNLDAVLTLYNSSGTVVATANPTDSIFATLTQTVAAGDYYLAVSGTGEYGAIGQYTLNGTVVPVPSVPTMTAPVVPQNTLRPTFTWSLGANAATYDLQVERVVNNVGTLVYSRSVTGLTHTAEVDLAEGTYRARVRGVTSTGTPSAFSPYLSFTIDVLPPGKPAFIDLNNASKLTTSFPTFEWTSVENAVNYTLEVNEILQGAGPGGTDVVVRQVIFRPENADTSYQHFTPLKDTNAADPRSKYSARVRATNESGENGEWSDTVRFTLDAAVPLKPIIVAPSAKTTNISPKIEWTGGEDGWKFDIQIDYLNQNPVSFIRSSNVIGRNSFQLNNLNQGTYVVSVRTINGNEEAGPWSNSYTFEVDVLPPDRPRLLTPFGTADSGKIVSLTPTFRWTPVARAESYDLWVNNQSTQHSQIIRNTSIKDAFFRSSTELPEGTYRIWVRARNSAGEFSPWSLPQTIVLDIPDPRVPVNLTAGGLLNGVITDPTPVFTWSRVVIAGELKALSDNEFYDLQVRNLNTNKIVIDVTGVRGTSYTVPNSAELTDKHTYQVTVRAGNRSRTETLVGGQFVSSEIKQYSNWSPLVNFTLQVPAPPVPVILAPGQSVNTNRPTFRWTHDPNGGAVRYQILVRDLLRQENIVLDVSSFTLNAQGNQATFTPGVDQALGQGNGNGTYRVWIRSFNSKNVASGWSLSKTFVIRVAALDSTENSSEFTLSTLVALTSQIDSSAKRNVHQAGSAFAAKKQILPEEHSAQPAESVKRDHQNSEASRSATSASGENDLRFHDAVMAMLSDPSIAGFAELAGLQGTSDAGIQ